MPVDILPVARGRKLTVRLPAEKPEEADIIVNTKVGKEVTFSLRTRDPALVMQRQAAALLQVERQFAALRQGPQPLTKKDRVAISGLLYKVFQEVAENDPGEPGIWKHVQECNEEALGGKEHPLAIPSPLAEDRIRLLEARFGGLVDLILAREGIVTDPRSRMLLLADAGDALQDAARKLERNAQGDYRPDDTATRFPAWEPKQPFAALTEAPRRSAGQEPKQSVRFAKPAGCAFDDIFEKWKRERTPAAVTVTSWRGYLKSFVSHLGHDDMSRVSKDDVLAWKDALIEQGYSGGSLQVGRIAAIKALFNFAVDNNLVASNPFDGVKLRQKRRAGTKMLAYEDEEVARLLALASRESLPSRRWLPWLAALTGARIAELAQLWGKRVLKVDGVHVLRLAPAEDGGSLKNEGSERDVPIHPAMVEQGFLEWVIEKGEGPLFYKKAVRAKEGGRHASKGVSNHLAEWIREQGFTDKRKAPNHALRHWFKSAMLRAGVQDSIADAIQGHKGNQGEAGRYRHVDVKTMAEAIGKLKVPLSVA